MLRNKRAKFEKYLAAHNEVLPFTILEKHNMESWCISQKCRIEGSQNSNETRMHSSRMRTGHSLTVCCSLLLGGGSPWSRGGVSAWSGGVLPAGGFSLVGGCLPGPGGVCLVPGVSAWSRGGLRRPLPPPPPCVQNHRHV